MVIGTVKNLHQKGLVLAKRIAIDSSLIKLVLTKLNKPLFSKQKKGFFLKNSKYPK